jgi:hypothetical protein
MLLLLHGEAGSWDEIAIAVAAFVVLWVAVKLAGRKSADDDSEEDEEGAALDEAPPAAPVEPSDEPARPPVRR